MASLNCKIPVSQQFPKSLGACAGLGAKQRLYSQDQLAAWGHRSCQYLTQRWAPGGGGVCVIATWKWVDHLFSSFWCLGSPVEASYVKDLFVKLTLQCRILQIQYINSTSLNEPVPSLKCSSIPPHSFWKRQWRKTENRWKLRSSFSPFPA